jgi:hypothetical protein
MRSRSAQKSCLALAILGVAFAVPVAVAFASLWHPGLKRAEPEWVAACMLQALPPDGIPQGIRVNVPRFDAWARLPDETVGYAFLRRIGTDEVRGLRGTYYLGSIVEYNAASGVFEAPCWNVQLDIDGRRLHSIVEWGDLQPVRTQVRGDVVYVNVADAR